MLGSSAVPLEWWKTFVASGAAVLALGGVAVAQEGETPSDDPPAAEEQPGTPGPPNVTGLQVPTSVTAQRGHARFLVGLSLSESATVTVLISRDGNGTPVRTFTTEGTEAAGQTFLLIDAIDDRNFQLRGGRYQIRVTATDADDESSSPITATMVLKLTRARGLLDAFLVPTNAPFAREAGVARDSGHVVAAVAPRGAAVNAGIRRGDVITKIGTRTINTPGELQSTLRQLKADKPTQVTFLRGGEERVGELALKPDWTEAPDYQRVLNIARKRDRRSRVVAYAQAKERLEAGEPAAASALRARWPVAWRKTAFGESVAGLIFEADEKHKKSLGAFNRALKKDPGLASAHFGAGVANAGLGRNDQAADEFATTAELDPGSASAHAFRAYVLIRAERPAEARDAAAQSIRLDPRYPDAHLPFGIALLALDQRQAGVKALRTGLRLLSDAGRADTLIEEHLDSSAT
jgi:hypothetical protein